jgi:hypothetical protein
VSEYGYARRRNDPSVEARRAQQARCPLRRAKSRQSGRKHQKPVAGHVYVVTFGDSLKIGRTVNPTENLRRYNVGRSYSETQAAYLWISPESLSSANYWEYALKDAFGLSRNERIPSLFPQEEVLEEAEKHYMRLLRQDKDS